ncbi:uncharacterized protein LOC142987206 [Anticarsia gemmatalis]|uniref:uncharacterized protein LOC142987206 n=1 Tax=Anticarsia gemmatalis TaxID=129554 RepID=UPI003F7587C2
MKPAEENVTAASEEPTPVTGDAIGNTTYSERFVLRTLIKFANLNTLKEELKEKSFEEDLCVLWDMTAERDVVLFLQRYDALKLFNFALSVIDRKRIVEIIIGIIANMCCLKEVVDDLMTMDSFLSIFIPYINVDYMYVRIQMMRLISACVYQGNEEQLTKWMEIFKNIEYSTTLYDVMQDTRNKNVLTTALENLNTICSKCNIESLRTLFFDHFVTQDAFDAVIALFKIIYGRDRSAYTNDELERVMVIVIQIHLVLLGFDKSSLIAHNVSVPVYEIVCVLNTILVHYECKMIQLKEMDTDLIDVVESIATIMNIIQDPEERRIEFQQCCLKSSYKMWEVITSATESNSNGSSFDDNDIGELEELCGKLKPALCTLICTCLSKSSNDILLEAMASFGVNNVEIIINTINDKELQKAVNDRTSDYRSRHRETNAC